MNEPIQEKAPKPPGLLPKHVQSWLLIGIAVSMVLIMWLTGGKKPTATPKANGPAATMQPPVEINETKITELQNRIEELQRDQLVAQNALAQQTRLLGSAASDQQGAPPPAGANDAPAAHAEDPIQAEKKKRDYLSLFESNVALTYRKEPTEGFSSKSASDDPATANASTPTSDITEIGQILKGILPTAPPVAAAPPGTPASAPEKNTSAEANNPERKEESRIPAAASGGSRSAAAGKNYILFEGTILESVLINRLEGQFAGPIECLLTTDVYSQDRQHLLIPSGTKLLGETKRVDNLGQTRLAVSFHRLIMPDGFSVSLDDFKGLDGIGDTGLRDQVNNHYLRIFGVSLAIGALGAVSEAGTGSALTSNGTDLMRQGFAESTAQSSAQVLDRFLNILPTLTIREGYRVRVYLSGDIALPDYNNHVMPSDL
jgi:type IV secretory pathway VirB10-like protein